MASHRHPQEMKPARAIQPLTPLPFSERRSPRRCRGQCTFALPVGLRRQSWLPHSHATRGPGRRNERNELIGGEAKSG